MKFDIFGLVIGAFIIKSLFFSSKTPTVNYTIKMSHKVIAVQHCATKDGIIVYKTEGRTKRMFASRTVKCVKTEG